MCRVSIAMTTYCGAKYIEKQLSSLLSQTRPADEVIIFDDVSQDDTAQIVREFISRNGLSNWHFKVNERNLGFILNFRQAIAETTGDIVFLCDQDDVWHADKIETLVKAFEETPKAMAINASFRFVDGNGEPILAPEVPNTANHGLIFKICKAGELTKFSESDIVKGNISPGCTMAFRAELRDYFLKHASGLLPHDFELNIYAAKLGGLYFLNRELNDYRIHSDNTIGLDTEEKTNSQFNGTTSNRLHILEEEKKEVEFFTKYYQTDDENTKAFIKAYAAFIKLREKCMLKHNPFAAIPMFSKVKLLEPNKTKRIVFGDLLYALHLEKFFKG